MYTIFLQSSDGHAAHECCAHSNRQNAENHDNSAKKERSCEWCGRIQQRATTIGFKKQCFGQSKMTFHAYRTTILNWTTSVPSLDENYLYCMNGLFIFTDEIKERIRFFFFVSFIFHSILDPSDKIQLFTRWPHLSLGVTGMYLPGGVDRYHEGDKELWLN